MKGKRFFLIIILLMLYYVTALGQNSELTQLGTSMANFLKIGVGARATAMGDAYVALSDDISSLYWNPGGLGTMNKNEALFQVTDWFLDSRFYFLGLSVSMGNIGKLGVSFSSFSSGDIEETTIDFPDGTDRTFDASNFAAGLTFSRMITNRFSTGLTLKYISEQLDTEKANTMALDVGSVFITNFLNNMRIGFSLSNLGGEMRLSGSGLNVHHIVEPGTKYALTQLATESWDIPLLFRFGIATDVIKKKNIQFTLATEVMDSRDYDYRIATGGEIALIDKIFLRAGYKFRYDETNLTLGAGFMMSFSQNVGMKIDYTYSDYGLLKNTQRFSVSLVF